MISPSFKITDSGSGVLDQLKADMKTLNGSFVKVGFPEGGKVGPAKKGKETPYSNMSEVARIAAWNEFGAEINHPGGTNYRSMSVAGRIITRFLKKSESGHFDKKTGPHKIVIPSRPFFRNAVDTNRQTLSDLIARIKDDVLLARITPAIALERIGIFMQGKIRRSMITGDWKPNAKSTIKRKGSSRPLVDSAQMSGSVTYTTHGAGEHVESEGLKVIR